MLPRIIEVRHVADYTLELAFSDGIRARVDLRDMVVGRGGVFQVLEDASVFAQARVDPEAGTVVWPNGVDLDPDVLYSRATGKPLPGGRRDNSDWPRSVAL